jgi:RNA polymerase sigma-70 factor (ECF subfamily)
VEQLIGQVADGNAPAFELLYDEVANRVFATVRRVLVSADESEEVTQEVLLEVWRTAHRFDPEKGSAESCTC